MTGSTGSTGSTRRSAPGARDLDAFVADLARRVEAERIDGRALGRDWDVHGDPAALTIARLWGFVADGVAAYTELTAAEATLPTARDWTDLRRITALVGHRPRARVAASGWARFDTDRGTSPIVPAGTRVQAPGVPGVREAQTYEVSSDVRLRAEWAGLTATPVPVPSAPTGRSVRFLHDPGFAVGDTVLLVLEQRPSTPAPVSSAGWQAYWQWLLLLHQAAPASQSTPVGLAVVRKRESDLGTVVVTFDRDLAGLLPDPGNPYVAYRVGASAGSARRLSKVIQLGATNALIPLTGSLAYGQAALGGTFVVLDTLLPAVSRHQLVVVVDWAVGGCDVASVSGHRPVEWEVAPGSPTAVTRLSFAATVPTLVNAGGAGRPVSVYVVDRRVPARHYRIPSATGPDRLRVFPAPAQVPERLAVRSRPDGAEPRWEVFRCAAAAQQETSTDPSAPRGLVLDLLDGVPAGNVDRAAASANLVPVRHGTTVTKPLGSGDAARAGQAFAVPTAPVAADPGPDGAPVSSLVVRVDGVPWREVPTLYAAGADDVYTTVLGADGSVTVRFGDGRNGNRLPTGRANITATYRVGGGLAGELPAGAIDTLVGSVRGVTGVEGVGPLTGGADQDDERRARSLAPARARAFDRIVSAGDLADLALGYPGVSHAAGWRGAGPPGCACGGSGLHLGFLRRTSTGARTPVDTEVRTLRTFLDARRDVAVPVCVCGGVVSALPVDAVLALDARRVEPALPAARRALVDPAGPLGAEQRLLGRPLDRSDVLLVLHGIDGVLGVTALTVPGIPPGDAVGRVPARPFELLVVAPESTVTGAAS